MENIILQKLEAMEKRLDRLEGKGVSAKEDGRKPHKQTVLHPSEMEVGTMAYTGKYESKDGKLGSTFGADCVETDKLLKVSSFEMAKVIDAFSSEERIDIIKELMKQNLRAKGLMERLGFATTGKLYHHLSFLEKLGIVRKDGEFYHVVARYISCILLIFAGVSKIIDKQPCED